MKTALVIFGSDSSEHDVSCVSACSVIKNIPSDKYETVMLGITKDGKWYLFEGDVDLLPEDKWVSSGKITPAILSPDSNDRGLVVFGENGVRKIHIDVVFPVLHGKNGEDGTIQGLLELAKLPYVGCGVLSSAVCMDKDFANAVADFAHIRQAKWLSVKKCDYKNIKVEFIKKCASYLGFPIFVKPANAGSSVGISKAKDASELEKAIEFAFGFDDKLVLEEAIVGSEVECAVLGNDEPIASCVGEIAPCNEFYDYEAKYQADSGLFIPARLSDEKTAKVRQAALEVYKALDCRGLSRCDFFVRESDGEVYFNEVNTIPGFTAISMYPKLFDKVGISYGELLDRLFTLAEENR
ncbi:MAG: D-alanine--D-alanine ligase [Ruminococcaceae bacterium]|jgi:D-alanine-D-alanine ligase|nr:D-alanine--D-alanine ligase [Oscillospiraceae bacterium]